MFPAGAVFRTLALLTGLIASVGCWILFWLVASLTDKGWSIARTSVAALCWIAWIGGWSLLTRLLWRKG